MANFGAQFEPFGGVEFPYNFINRDRMQAVSNSVCSRASLGVDAGFKYFLHLSMAFFIASCHWSCERLIITRPPSIVRMVLNKYSAVSVSNMFSFRDLLVQDRAVIRPVGLPWSAPRWESLGKRLCVTFSSEGWRWFRGYVVHRWMCWLSWRLIDAGFFGGICGASFVALISW